jgi:hypothetical protein
MPDNTERKIIQDDVPIWGASAIGRELGLNRGSVYHLLSRNLLPARRIGRKWVSTRSQLQTALGTRSE